MTHDAAYYRDYRARVRARREVAKEPVDPPEARLRARLLELEEEVRHLKTELARRRPILDVMAGPSVAVQVKRIRVEPNFNSRPFTPAPKVPSSRSR